MEGFYNEEQKSSQIKVSIVSFRGDKTNPRFQVWNRSFDVNKDTPKDNQEIRNGYCYDTYEKFEGFIDDMALVDVPMNFDGTPRTYKRLYVYMKPSHDAEAITFDMGTYTERYAQSFLERMMNQTLNVNEKVILYPYHVSEEGKKSNIGVMIYQGKDKDGKPAKIAFLKKEQKIEMGVPEPEVIQTDQGEQWVWGKRIQWMFRAAKYRLDTEKEEPKAAKRQGPPPGMIEPDPIEPEFTKGEIGAKLYDTGGTQKPTKGFDDDGNFDDDDSDMPF